MAKDYQRKMETVQVIRKVSMETAKVYLEGYVSDAGMCPENPNFSTGYEKSQVGILLA
jgi:hypothetical protein